MTHLDRLWRLHRFMHPSLQVKLGLILLAVLLMGCQSRPSPSQLQALRREAKEENRRLLESLAVASGDAGSEADNWTLTISGQIDRSEPRTIRLADLSRLASRRVATWNPNNPISTSKVQNFQGVLVSDLLSRFGAATKAKEVTFVSSDAFRTPVPIEDIVRYPIILATHKDGRQLERVSGGPIYLVFPYLDAPELVTRYPDRYWAFYVSHMIVGTESVSVRVGTRMFDEKSLDAMPQVAKIWPVGFRGFWPHAPVELKGIRVADVLQSAGLKGKTLLVRGKARLSAQQSALMSFPWQDIRACELLLVTASGPLSERLPARLGGPVALAISPSCRTRYSDRNWVTFVSALEVKA